MSHYPHTPYTIHPRVSYGGGWYFPEMIERYNAARRELGLPEAQVLDEAPDHLPEFLRGSGEGGRKWMVFPPGDASETWKLVDNPKWSPKP